MRSLFFLIIRFGAFVTFLILEFVAFYLIINYNKSQKEIWAHSSSLVSGNIYKQVNSVENFFELNERNDSLLLENARLLESVINYRLKSDSNIGFLENGKDTVHAYHLIEADICNKTINLRNNFLTLCKGSNDGIKVGMGVITKGGVIGIVKAVSQNFATVLMVINSQSRVSAKILNTSYHGNILWKDSDTRKMKMNDVPKHAEISIGDTIVTSGYSISFPPLIPIGRITAYNLLEGGNSYEIDVELSYDLSNIDMVYVVNYGLMDEKKALIATENE